MKHLLNISNEEYLGYVSIVTLVNLYELLIQAFPDDLVLIQYYNHGIDAHVITGKDKEAPYAEN